MTPTEVLIAFARREPRTLTHWEIGKLLDLLADPASPVITGLEGGPFDVACHADESRRNCYVTSKLRLSPLGEALLKGVADFAEKGRINRWWGGIHLAKEECWRWDAPRQMVIPPIGRVFSPGE